MLVPLLLPLFWALLAFSFPTRSPSPYLTKESLPSPPPGWTLRSPAPADHILELQIGLVQSRWAELEQRLREVSDPTGGEYGKWLAKGEVEELVRPDPTGLELVHAWLAEHSVPASALSYSPAQDWVRLRLPVSLAESLLQTKYHVFSRSSSNEHLVRSLSYSLPEVLHRYVDVVQPTTMFGRMRPNRATLLSSPSSASASPPVPESCNTTITPACLKSLYSVGNYTPSASPANRNMLGIAGYLGQYANHNDTAWFLSTYLPEAYAANYTFAVELTTSNSTNSQVETDAGVEADLDVQYGGSLSYPIPNTYYSTAGSPPFIPDLLTATDTNEPYEVFLAYMLAKEDEELPRTLTTSYGDDEQTVPFSYATRVCAEFAQLGARGVSVVFSSGDNGVGDGLGPGQGPTSCLSNDGQNRTTFLPLFPASCPYVTSVGGTWYIEPEQAVFFSGGGFSNYFSRPFYQEEAVPKYLSTLAPGTYEGLYNPLGRGIPDVAAQAYSFSIVWNSSFGLVAGTSCAAPTFAGIISLVNSGLAERGRPGLGWLNPWIYSGGYEGLTDIKLGNNPGCLTEGFNATEGWDPVTGWGTPDFAKLSALAWNGPTGYGGVL